MARRRHFQAQRGKEIKDPTPNVLEPEIFRELWGITAQPLDAKIDDREKVKLIVKDLSQQVAKKVHEVETLMVEFKSIKKIDNLWGFEKLTVLKLDNNVIDRIDNISHLTTLTELDLSFNKLTKIEHIESLTNLTDLNLSNNQIRRIENLDSLVKLNSLILGYNKIGSTEDGGGPGGVFSLQELNYLRRFDNLRLLVLDGNDIAKNPNYKNFVVAHIKKLMYLDFRLVDEDMKREAEEKYSDERRALELHEREAEEEKERLKKADERKRKLAAANLDGFDSLFESMFEADPEFRKVRVIRSLEEPVAQQREKIETLTDDFIDTVLQQHETRQVEIDMFEKEVAEARRVVDEEAVSYIRDFEEYKKELYRNLAALSEDDVESFDNQLNDDLSESIMQLSDALMEMETYQVQQLDDALQAFSNRITDMQLANQDPLASYFQALRQLEDNFFEYTITTSAHEILEQAMRGELEEEAEMSDELRRDVNDREAFKGIFSMSHEFRLDRIKDKDTQLKEKIEAQNEELFEKYRREFARRNRARVEEITQLTLHYDNEKNLIREQVEIPPTLLA